MITKIRINMIFERKIVNIFYLSVLPYVLFWLRYKKNIVYLHIIIDWPMLTFRPAHEICYFSHRHGENLF